MRALLRAQANLVASVLTGNVDHGRKLSERAAPEARSRTPAPVHARALRPHADRCTDAPRRRRPVWRAAGDACLLAHAGGAAENACAQTLQETQWDVKAIHQALGFGDAAQSRKLQQDTVAVRPPPGRDTTQ